jgi:hypothetical protein
MAQNLLRVFQSGVKKLREPEISPICTDTIHPPAFWPVGESYQRTGLWFAGG